MNGQISLWEFVRTNIAMSEKEHATDQVDVSKSALEANK